MLLGHFSSFGQCMPGVWRGFRHTPLWLMAIHTAECKGCIWECAKLLPKLFGNKLQYALRIPQHKQLFIHSVTCIARCTPCSTWIDSQRRWWCPHWHGIRVLDGLGAPQPRIPVALAGPHFPYGNVGDRVISGRFRPRGGSFHDEDQDGPPGAVQCGHWGEALSYRSSNTTSKRLPSTVCCGRETARGTRYKLLCLDLRSVK